MRARSIAAVATVIVTAAAVTTVSAVAEASQSAPGKTATLTSAPACNLGNGIKHVVQITFDNVHYFRDNPNVPSDLELMPNLLHFFENNGSLLTNDHTPIIAHTANDILTTLTGLYGDRHGVGISNSYQSYNADGPNGTFGTTDPATAFNYWTDKIDDTSRTPSPARDTNPNMVYSPVPPTTAGSPVSPTTVTPAPWVPFTKAGCDVGNFSTANVVLENTFDIPQVFGANSPEAQQLAADPDRFKDAETDQYIGVAVHCALGSAVCADAKGIKFGQTTPTPTAAPDLLPDQPGGYNGFQALFGARYTAPQLGAGTPSLFRNGYEITNSAGNLVDLNGNQINGAFTGQPGFPGFDPVAPQTLAYAADMLESGIPVVQTYISDIHGNEDIPALSSVCAHAPSALAPGTPCYLAQAAYYNDAFGAFFKRLAAENINTSNTLFVLSSDEGDHVAGANVGRAIQPSPANCDGVTVVCTYPAGSFGELSGNIKGLLVSEKNNNTAYGLENDSAPEFYLHGAPAPDDAVTRQFEHDLGSLTVPNPYAGQTSQQLANYLADPTEEAILHMVDADPARTPTVAMFARPDFFLSNGPASCNPSVVGTGGCVSVNSGFAYNHGDFAAEINTNYVGFAGPGVRAAGVLGNQPNAGPNSAGPDSGQIAAIDSGTAGPWTDETDINPTMLYLTGLSDPYTPDGRVITEILSSPNSALSAPGVTELGACYKQLDASTGQFGTYTLRADTAALESTSFNDTQYKGTENFLGTLLRQRDQLAEKIKSELDAAEFSNTPVEAVHGDTTRCGVIIDAAKRLSQRP